MNILRKLSSIVILVGIFLTTSGCHLLSHYSTEEVHDYLHQRYPTLTYTLTEQFYHAWTVSFDKYPNMPIAVEESFHTSAPVVPQIDRILTNNIPTVTVLPLCKNYLTETELSYVIYDDDYRYIKIEIPDSAIKNGDVADFHRRIEQLCNNYAVQYPEFKKDIRIAIFTQPPKGVDEPEGY